MDFFKEMYSLSDLGIVHGLRILEHNEKFNDFISVNTIIRMRLFRLRMFQQIISIVYWVVAPSM